MDFPTETPNGTLTVRYRPETGTCLFAGTDPCTYGQVDLAPGLDGPAAEEALLEALAGGRGRTTALSLGWAQECELERAKDDALDLEAMRAADREGR